jgi:hypothetical protein
MDMPDSSSQEKARFKVAYLIPFLLVVALWSAWAAVRYPTGGDLLVNDRVEVMFSEHLAVD